MSLEKKIDSGIVEAMKAKDSVTRDTLRNVKKYIIEEKKKGANIEHLTDDQVLKIIQRLAKQSTDSAQIYKEQNRDDLYDYEMAQVEVLEKYLPEQLSAEELTAKVKEIIAQMGATSMQEMGKVMGVAMKQLAGVADGRAISDKVKELLS